MAGTLYIRSYSVVIKSVVYCYGTGWSNAETKRLALT